MHARRKIVSLEQRRRNQLLLLMYKKSKDIYRCIKGLLEILGKVLVLF